MYIFFNSFFQERRQCYFGNEKELPHYTTYTVSNCMDECITRRTLEDCGCTRYYMPRKMIIQYDNKHLVSN